MKPTLDLETSLLEIRTNSVLKSKYHAERVDVTFYDSHGNEAGGLWIPLITPTPRYYLSYCSSWNNITSTLPTAVDKVWRIGLTKTSGIRLQIHCNNVEVVNFLLSNQTCNDDQHWDWRRYWSRDVEKIGFDIYDTASDFYRPFIPGLTFILS